MLVTVIIAVYCLAISPVEGDTVNADGKVDLILKFNFPLVWIRDSKLLRLIALVSIYQSQ